MNETASRMQKWRDLLTGGEPPDTAADPARPSHERQTARQAAWDSIRLAPADWKPFQWVCFGLLAGLCAFTRLYDLGHKAPMHDESLFLYYSFEQLYRSWTYNYMPILHGPLMLQFQALVWHIFGHSDYTMRLGAALLGIGGFFLVWGLRPWLGEAGTWFALVFYTISGSLSYYQRFYRNDSLFVFLTLLIIFCAVRMWRTGSRKWAAALVVSVTLIFCNKENCVMLYFSGASFLAFWVVQDLIQGLLRGKDAAALSRAGAARAPEAVPNVFLLNVILWVCIAVAMTRIFEGFGYEAGVVEAIGHDYPLKSVRSLHLLLGYGMNANPAAAPLLERPGFWRAFYLGGFLFTLALLFLAKRFILAEAGAREALARFWNLLARAKWYLAAAAAFSLFIYLGVFTTWFRFPRGPLQIYRETFSYWLGQHAQHRIQGPFHYYLVILLIYELPAVLMIFGGWLCALGRSRPGRMIALPLLAAATLAALWYFNGPEWKQFMTSPALDAAGKQLAATGKDFLYKKLHISGGAHIWLIFFLSFSCVWLTWQALHRGQIFHAWLIWWTVTSFGAYSYAGEKVPWVVVHVALPCILLASSYAEKLWYAPWMRRRPAVFLALAALFFAWNAKGMINANFRHADDIRERIVYGHFSQDIRAHAKAIQAYTERATIRTDWMRNHNNRKLTKQVRVAVKSDAAVWPLHWYLRDIDYNWTPSEQDLKTAHTQYEFVFLDPTQLTKYPEIKEQYRIYEGRGTCFWVPQLPDMKRLRDVWLFAIPPHYLRQDADKTARSKAAAEEWAKLKKYYLWRHTFEYPGQPYPSVSSVNYYFCVRKDVDL